MPYYNYQTNAFNTHSKYNDSLLIDKDIKQLCSLFDNCEQKNFEQLKNIYLKAEKIKDEKLLIPCISLKIYEADCLPEQKLANFVDLIRKYNIFLEKHYKKHKEQTDISESLTEENIILKNIFYCCGNEETQESTQCKHNFFNSDGRDILHSFISRKNVLEKSLETNNSDVNCYLERIPSVMQGILKNIIVFRNTDIFAKHKHMSRYFAELYKKNGLSNVIAELSTLGISYNRLENFNANNYSDYLLVMNYNEFNNLCKELCMVTQKNNITIKNYEKQNTNLAKKICLCNTNKTQQSESTENIILKSFYNNEKYNEKYYYGKYFYKEPVVLINNNYNPIYNPVSYLPNVLNSFDFETKVLKKVLDTKDTQYNIKIQKLENTAASYSCLVCSLLLSLVIYNLSISDIYIIHNILKLKQYSSVKEYQDDIQFIFEKVNKLCMKTFNGNSTGLQLNGNEKNIEILAKRICSAIDQLAIIDFNQWYGRISFDTLAIINIFNFILNFYNQKISNSKNNLKLSLERIDNYYTDVEEKVRKFNDIIYNNIDRQYSKNKNSHKKLKESILPKIQKGESELLFFNKFLEKLCNDFFYNYKMYDFYLEYLKSYKKTLEESIEKNVFFPLQNNAKKNDYFEEIISIPVTWLNTRKYEVYALQLFFEKTLNIENYRFINPVKNLLDTYVLNEINNKIKNYETEQKNNVDNFITQQLLECFTKELQEYYKLYSLEKICITNKHNVFFKNVLIPAIFQSIEYLEQYKHLENSIDEQERKEYEKICNAQDQQILSLVKPLKIHDKRVKTVCKPEKIQNYTLINEYLIANSSSITDLQTQNTNTDNNETINNTYNFNIINQESLYNSMLTLVVKNNEQTENNINLKTIFTNQQINDYYFVKFFLNPLNGININAINSVFSHQSYKNYKLYIDYFREYFKQYLKIKENLNLEKITSIDFIKQYALNNYEKNICKETFCIFTDFNYKKNHIPEKITRYNTKTNNIDRVFILNQIRENIENNNNLHFAGKGYGTRDTQEILLDTLEMLYNNYSRGEKFQGQIIIELDSPTGLETLKAARIKYLLTKIKLNKPIMFLAIINPTDITLLCGKIFGIDYGKQYLSFYSKIFVNNKYLHKLEDLYKYCYRVYNSQQKNIYSFFTCIDNKEHFSKIKPVLFGTKICKNNINLQQLYFILEKANITSEKN